MMARPFLPPSLQILMADEDGSAAARIAAEERIRAQAHEAGRQRGLEEGLAQGRREGEAAGHARAEQEMQARLATQSRTGAAAAVQALEQLHRERGESRRRLDQDLRAAVAAALGAVFPALLARAAGGEVAALLSAVLAERAADVITLHAHPATLAAAQHDGFPDGPMPERLRLQPDATMPEGQAEARWANGGLLYEPAALVARVQAILGGPPADETPQEKQQ